MNSKRFLIKLQYLGIRFHGVQKQKDHTSIQERVEKAIGLSVKTIFSSRTDAFVSALENYCLVMFEEEVEQGKLEEALSKLPPDIRVLEMRKVSRDFTMLSRSKEKEYHYYFSFNEVSLHPFCAPFMTLIREELNLEVMKKGAELFCGTHTFINYAYKPKPDSLFERTILKSEIVENHEFTASFFPERSYCFKVKGHGFLRGQVRLMMGALFRLGMGELTLSSLEKSLKEEDPDFVKWQAPPTGLILKETKLE